MAAGDSHNLILMNSGRLYTFGYNNMGQCGVGTTKNVLVARPVEQVLQLADVYTQTSETPKWLHVAGGRDHSLAISQSGLVYATGNNAKGTLGLPGLSHACYFSKVHTIESAMCARVFAGVDHSFVLLDKVAPKHE